MICLAGVDEAGRGPVGGAGMAPALVGVAEPPALYAWMPMALPYLETACR